MKVTDLISNSFSYSVEVTPNINEEELSNLKLEPLFYSVTWHAKLHQCKDLNIPPLKLAYKLCEKGKNVLLHLSCDLLAKKYLDLLMKRLQEIGICNLFTVMGGLYLFFIHFGSIIWISLFYNNFNVYISDNYNSNTSDFQSCNDLIKYIRKSSGNYFCIGVAGNPDHDDRLTLLKEKIDAGANFIITQACFEGDVFVHFKNKCTEMKINVPIFPGIFVFETNQELYKFLNICKLKIGEGLSSMINPENNQNCDICKNFILKLKRSNVGVHNFHFFAINKCSNKCLQEHINYVLGNEKVQ